MSQVSRILWAAALVALAHTAPAQDSSALTPGDPRELVDARDPRDALPVRGPIYLCGSSSARALVEPELAARSVHVTLALDDRAAQPSANSTHPYSEAPMPVRLALAARTLAAHPELPRPPDPSSTDARIFATWLAELPARELTLEFLAGDPESWARTLFPARTPSPLIQAVWRAHAEGCAIVASGRSAAAIAGAAIVDPVRSAGWRTPREALARNPRQAGQRELYWSLGFFPWALVEVEPSASDVANGPADGAASFARFVDVLHEERLRFGVWLGSGSALAGSTALDRFEGLSTEAALVLDLRPARRSQGWLLEARLSELGLGDSWRGATRSVTAPESVAPTPPTEREGLLELEPLPGEPLLGRATIERALRALAASSAERCRISTAERGIELVFDARTSAVEQRLHQVRFSVWSPDLGR